MKRLLFVLVLALGLVLAGCDASNPQNERAGKERGPEKAAKAERPGEAGASDKKTGSSEQEEPPSQADTHYSTGPSPDEVLSSQYEHINAGRYGAAYNLFDDVSQQTISLKEYKAYFASVAPYEITAYSFSSVRTQGNTASVVADLAVTSSEGYDEYGVTQALVREDGAWRVVVRGAQIESFSEAGTSPGTSTASASASASASPSPSTPSGEPGGDYDATVTGAGWWTATPSRSRRGCRA